METKLEQIAVKAVNQLPKSVVREIRTLRSVGTGGGPPPPVTRWARRNPRPHRDHSPAAPHYVRFQGAGSTGRRNTGVKSLCWRFKLQGLAWSFVYTRKIALCVPHFSVLAEVIATTDLLLSAPSRIAHRFAAGHAIRV